MTNAADLIVRCGRVCDGAGGAPFEADVAVGNGPIAAVGRCDGPAVSGRVIRGDGKPTGALPGRMMRRAGG